MKKLFVCALLTALIAYSCGDKKGQTNTATNEPKHISANPGFNEEFAILMSDYYSLKDNFISENDSMINKYSRALLTDADSLHFDQFRADSNIVAFAKTTAENMSGELQGLLGENTIENKRKSFYTLSEQLYDLIRAVQYDKEPVYRILCNTIFENTGASWLNNSVEIKNPYSPKKIPGCGSITDTIDFRKKLTNEL